MVPRGVDVADLDGAGRNAWVTAAIEGAARVAGGVADAVLAVDAVEAARRRDVGTGGVGDLALLDTLMCLPVGCPVATDDLTALSRARLRAAPPGCVEWLDEAAVVVRWLVPAVNVELVVVRSATWRAGLLRASAFEPFATRVVLLDRPPRALHQAAWEADAAGVGLWLSTAGTATGCEAETLGEVQQVVAPAPFVRRYVKPAGWRFTERAYAAWAAADVAVSAIGR